MIKKLLVFLLLGSQLQSMELIKSLISSSDYPTFVTACRDTDANTIIWAKKSLDSRKFEIPWLTVDLDTLLAILPFACNYAQNGWLLRALDIETGQSSDSTTIQLAQKLAFPGCQPFEKKQKLITLFLGKHETKHPSLNKIYLALRFGFVPAAQALFKADGLEERTEWSTVKDRLVNMICDVIDDAVAGAHEALFWSIFNFSKSCGIYLHEVNLLKRAMAKKFRDKITLPFFKHLLSKFSIDLDRSVDDAHPLFTTALSSQNYDAAEFLVDHVSQHDLSKSYNAIEEVIRSGRPSLVDRYLKKYADMHSYHLLRAFQLAQSFPPHTEYDSEKGVRSSLVYDTMVLVNSFYPGSFTRSELAEWKTKAPENKDKWHLQFLQGVRQDRRTREELQLAPLSNYAAIIKLLLQTQSGRQVLVTAPKLTGYRHEIDREDYFNFQRFAQAMNDPAIMATVDLEAICQDLARAGIPVKTTRLLRRALNARAPALLVRQLIKAGASVDKTKKGNPLSLLGEALSTYQFETAAVLAEHGAPPRVYRQYPHYYYDSRGEPARIALQIVTIGSPGLVKRMLDARIEFDKKAVYEAYALYKKALPKLAKEEEAHRLFSARYPRQREHRDTTYMSDVERKAYDRSQKIVEVQEFLAAGDEYSAQLMEAINEYQPDAFDEEHIEKCKQNKDPQGQGQHRHDGRNRLHQAEEYVAWLKDLRPSSYELEAVSLRDRELVLKLLIQKYAADRKIDELLTPQDEKDKIDEEFKEYVTHLAGRNR